MFGVVRMCVNVWVCGHMKCECVGVRVIGFEWVCVCLFVGVSVCVVWF